MYCAQEIRVHDMYCTKSANSLVPSHEENGYVGIHGNTWEYMGITNAQFYRITLFQLYQHEITCVMGFPFDEQDCAKLV